IPTRKQCLPIVEEKMKQLNDFHKKPRESMIMKQVTMKHHCEKKVQRTQEGIKILVG
ncbi:hypothetical protein CROQUDRAFT_48156, partial [Cronartium quercuum f. sp. fusiforme G11]